MKKILLTFLMILFSTFAFALPGIDSFIQDISGEYVYYKDSTFERESYVGILCYDDSTFQIRYLAPKNEKNFTPAKDITILVTINPDSPVLELTGEKIISTIIPNSDDALIVNYLHDILYDFSAKRQKMGRVTGYNKKTQKILDDYPQFGGKVTIEFDAMIPIFSIKSITDPTGKVVFSCATIGRISSAADNSFETFAGFPEVSNSTSASAKQAKISKSAKTVSKKYTFGKQSITLDSNWTQPMENFWVLGNDSLIAVADVPSYSNDDIELNDLFILRRLLESTSGSYYDFSSLEISTDSKKSKYKITTKNYLPESKKYTMHVQILTRVPLPSKTQGFEYTNLYAFKYLSISTYLNAYNENPSYFDKIVKSYKSN